MTVSAQQFEIVHLLFPILQSPLNRVSGAMFGLSRCIDVIDFEDSQIVDAALLALATKGAHDGNLLLVLPHLAAGVVVVFEPVRQTARLVAVSERTGLAARLALTAAFPASRYVALARTVFGTAPVDDVILWIERFFAVAADVFGHASIIAVNADFGLLRNRPQADRAAVAIRTTRKRGCSMTTSDKQRLALKQARDEAMRRARNARFYAGGTEASERTRATFLATCAEYVREARELNHRALQVR